MATPAQRSNNSPQRFRRDKEYRKLFDARLMQKRLELGLPLVSTAGIGDVPKEFQQAYQDASVHAAREVGELMLADRNIPQAWPYFRAIGDTGPIIQALDAFDVADTDTPESQEALGSTIQIAFQEGLHPRKGFELILKHYGLCRAITMFSAYPQRDGRNESLRLLVRSLHGQIVDNLRHAISDVEGARPESHSIAALIEGRDWLFENNAQHTDSSHIGPVLRFSAELDDKETLKLAVEIADYASRLGPLFQVLRRSSVRARVRGSRHLPQRSARRRRGSGGKAFRRKGSGFRSRSGWTVVRRRFSCSC